MLNFHIYDVFTDRPFTGNPLAIVEGADGLSTAQMQTIARQFNLSETIFIQTPDDPSHTAKVRIFFPTAEIPFAGHPTIGCALHLSQGTSGLITLEEVAGLVPVTIADAVAEFITPKQPAAKPVPSDPALWSASIGLTPSDLGPHAAGHFEGGPSFLYLQLASTEALSRAQVQEPAFTELTKACKGTDAIYLYVETASGVQARMFHPHAGIAEDPATGSATALLAGQLLANGALPATGVTVFNIRQGVEMGRPSDLRLTIDTTDAQISAIRVAGRATPVARGQIARPAL